MKESPHFFDLTPQSLREHADEAGWPDFKGFRADQVIEWVYRKGVADVEQMSNLSKKDRETLAANLHFFSSEVIQHQNATDGTQKLLMQWKSGETKTIGGQTECVMIPVGSARRNRKTACVSSQVGCPVGCTFCASGLGGLDGNLTAGQIIEQVWRLQQLPGVERITNVVFMGMGEPMSNLDNVIRAIRTMTAEWGMAISARRITVSTVGLPAQIRRLAEIDLPVTLAISLHAPNDELRRQIIPWAQFVTIEQILDAGRYYFDKTGREITLEYILLSDVNDQAEHAAQLAKVARTLRSNVNLIRYNEVKGLPFGRPRPNDVLQFQQILRDAGVNAHIRASRGRDIAAACGQLRHEHSKAG